MSARDPLTIRFPFELLKSAREVKTEDESLNDLVVEAVEREVRRRQGLAAVARIVDKREQLRAREGLQPDSRPLIRALREGSGRRD